MTSGVPCASTASGIPCANFGTEAIPFADVPSCSFQFAGDDEETVRVHCERSVPERQARLTNILKDAFHGQLKTTLTVLRGGHASGSQHMATDDRRRQRVHVVFDTKSILHEPSRRRSL
jgi:hypothetical protein